MTKFVGEAAMMKLWELMKSWVTKKLTDGSVTRVGTASVGRSTQPMYLDAGTPKAVTTFVVGTQTAATNAWTGSVPGLTAYYDGLTIDYYLPFAGTSSAATLNLNSLGACKVWNGRGRSNTTTHFPQYSIIRLTYYGGSFYASAYYDSNSVYLSAMCWSSAGTSAKTASASSFYPYAGVFMLLTMNTANTYSGKMTLNVNSRGAKDLWINGKVSSADNCTLPVGTYPCYYDGSVWHLYTDGRMRVKTLQADAVQANDIRMVYTDGTSSAVATMDDIDGVLSAASTLNGNDLWNEGNNLAMGGIVEWAGTQSASVTVKNSSTSSVAGVYLYNGKLIAKGTDGNWYGNWQDSGRWGDTADGGGWQPSKNVVYRLSGSNTLWRWSGTAMERMIIAADSATNLSSSAGSSTQPVYFSGGKPVACTMQTTMNALCNALSTGTSTPTDNDYYICQYAGGGTSTTSFHRRPVSALCAYLKGKMDSLYAKASHTHSIGNVSGLQTSLDGKLNKTTYEVNTELQMGSSGKVCLGKYTCGDSNITIEIASTAASTYHGTLVIATQNITSSGSGTYTAKVYGDADSALTPLIKIQRSGAVFAVYADLPTYSKNLIHARCSNPAAAPTDIATQVSEIPSAATIKPDNALGRFATASSVASISSTVSGHTTQLSDLNLRTVQHSDKSIVCTTATAPDSQGKLVGKTGFYAGQAVYMGVQATYMFFAASESTGTLVVYGQGVGTKGGGTMANQIMYSRTAANAWTKLG